MQLLIKNLILFESFNQNFQNLNVMSNALLYFKYIRIFKRMFIEISTQWCHYNYCNSKYYNLCILTSPFCQYEWADW